MSVACSVMPSGQPKRQKPLLGASHPARANAPRRPSAPTRASLLTRATARCLLVPRPDRPDGLLARSCRRPGDREAHGAHTPTTVWAETIGPRSATDHRQTAGRWVVAGL